MALILNPTDVVCRVHRLRAEDDGEFWGGAEPYLWSAFFKIDGETVTANLDIGLGVDFSLDGTATVISPEKGSHGNLGIPGGSIDTGEFVTIPDDLGQFETELTPIPLTINVASWMEAIADAVVLQVADIISGLDSDARCSPLQPDTDSLLGDLAVEFITDMVGGIPGAFGGIYVLMEEDFLSDAAAEAGRIALRDNLQVELDDKIIPGISLTETEPSDDVMDEVQATIAAAVEGSVMGAIQWWEWPILGVLLGDADDQLGTVQKMMTHIQIESGEEEDFEHTLDAGGHGKWQIRGRIGPND